MFPLAKLQDVSTEGVCMLPHR